MHSTHHKVIHFVGDNWWYSPVTNISPTIITYCLKYYWGCNKTHIVYAMIVLIFYIFFHYQYETDIPVWQLFPEYPGLHVHVYPCTWFSHVPPCWHGDDVHLFTKFTKNKNLREITSIFNKNDDGVHFVLDQQA